MYRKIIECLKEKGVDWDEVNKINEEVWNRLKEVDSSSYQYYKDELEGLLYTFTKQEAEDIVRSMQPFGEVWSMQQVADYISDRGITDNMVEWYMVMNMVRNDYNQTAANYNLQNDIEFFYSLANDFVNDPDGKPYKVGKYFTA